MLGGNHRGHCFNLQNLLIMKQFKSLPQNNDFFSRYASLVPALKIAGYLGQVVSALTEFGVLYASIYSGLVFFVPGTAPMLSVLGAALGVVIIEIGLRKLLPYSVRAVLFRRFSGLDAPMTIIIWLGAIGLLCCGTLMSYHGSRDVVDHLKPKPRMQGTAKAQKVYAAEYNTVMQSYRADSTEVATRYAPQITAIQAEYKAKIAQAESKLKGIEAKERSGQRFSTQKGQVKTELATLSAAQATKLAAVEAEKGKELSAATQRKTAALAIAGNALQKAKTSVERANTAAIENIDNRTNRYKGGLSWFTVICHFLLIVSIAIDEIHKKGAGIEEKVFPTQYDFSGTVFSDFWHAISCKVNQALRSAIRRIEESTPPPPLPLSPNELYSLENLNQPVFNVSFEQLPAAYQNITVPNRIVPAQAATPNPTQPPLAMDETDKLKAEIEFLKFQLNQVNAPGQAAPPQRKNGKKKVALPGQKD